MDNKLSAFLLSSINDIQSTIRALDTKVGFLFVVLFLPYRNCNKIYSVCYSFLFDKNNEIVFLNFAIIVLFLTSWCLSFISLIRAIMSIENPSSHIVNSSDYSGSFYCGGLFPIKFIDSLINRGSITASKDVRRYVESLPSSEDEIVNELAFEQMKLAYIRDMKFIRQRWAYKFTIIWLLSGFTIYILNKVN